MARIGDILTRHLSAVSVQDDVTYKQVTIRTNYRGVVLRGHKAGIEIGTKKQWAVKPGQFILSRIDARQGAFGIVPDELDGAIVTNDFMAYELNETAVDREFFNVFLQSPIFLNACVKASRGNTNRKRVQEDFFLDYEVNLPPLADQKRLIRQINTAQAKLDIADAELNHQRTLAEQLEQAILQAAIRGELTAVPRKVGAFAGAEPAEQLLQRIAAEKARLVKEKKLRKTKPLPPLTEEEKPFPLPDGWAWCRPDDLCLAIIDCPHSTPKFTSSGEACIDSTCINQDGEIDFTSIRHVSKTSFDERNRRIVPEPGDIVYVREGIIGKAVLLPESPAFCLGQRVMLYRTATGVDGIWFRHVVTSKFFLDEIAERHKGWGAKHINMSDLRSMPIPVPSLAEQSAIVERMESLMSVCRSLEAEVAAAADHAADLRRAVLQQAFAPQPLEVAANP